MQAIDLLQRPDSSRSKSPRKDQLQGWLKTALLLGLAVYFVYNILSGNLTNYINQRFSWLSYVAVVLFALLGIANALELLRGSIRIRSHGEVLTWRALAIFAIPLILGTLIPSQPLGATAVDGNISLNTASVTNATTFTTNPLEWNVLDWLRAFNAADDIKSFNGKEANVIGFVYREASFPDDQFMVARFTISCCVADASALGLPVIWANAPDIQQDTWVQVKGNFQVEDFRGDTVPVLHANTVEVVPQPEHPYLYP